MTHVDGHALTLGEAHRGHLGDVLGGLHVRGVTACTENDGDLGVGVDVVRRNERTGRVVDEGGELGANVLQCQPRLLRGFRGCRCATSS